MQQNSINSFHLLGEVQKLQKHNREVEHQLLVALGFRRPLPVYERAVRWLLATLLEKPVRRMVDAIFNRLDRWRKDR